MDSFRFVSVLIFLAGMFKSSVSDISGEQELSKLLLEVSSLRSAVSRLRNECITKSDHHDITKRQQTHETIAFSAYLTQLANGPDLGKLAEIDFDKIETNIGNGYDQTSGTFRAPKDGIYAFSWTIFVDGGSSRSEHGEITTELVVNGQVHGTLHADTEFNNDDDSSTGFVIKVLDKDDVVFIRSILKELI